MAHILQSLRKPHFGPEQKLLEIIQDEKMDSCYVCFGYKIPNHPTKTRGSDIDTLIIAPGVGVFIIEVKGNYKIDDNGNFYFKYSTEDVWDKSQSPYDQIDENFQGLINFLKKENEYKNFFPIPLVVFPVCEFNHYSQTAPKERTLDIKTISENGFL